MHVALVLVGSSSGMCFMLVFVYFRRRLFRVGDDHMFQQVNWLIRKVTFVDVKSPV